MGTIGEGFYSALFKINGVYILMLYLIPFFSYRLKGFVKKGYPEEYVKTMKREVNYIALRYFLLNSIIQVAVFAGFFFSGFEITGRFYVRNIFVLSFIPSFAYHLYLHRKFSLNYKEAIKKSSAEMAVDFNHKMLDMVINWKLEVMTLAVFIYFSLSFPGDYMKLFIIVAVGLANYIVFRIERFMVFARMRDALRALPVLVIILHAAKIYLCYKIIYPNYTLFDGTDLVMYFVLCVFLGLALTLSVASFFRVHKALGFYSQNIAPALNGSASDSV